MVVISLDISAFEFDSIGKSFTKIVFAGKTVQSAQPTTARDVNGLYLDQEGMRILVFRKALFDLSK